MLSTTAFAPLGVTTDSARVAWYILSLLAVLLSCALLCTILLPDQHAKYYVSMVAYDDDGSNQLLYFPFSFHFRHNLPDKQLPQLSLPERLASSDQVIVLTRLSSLRSNISA